MNGLAQSSSDDNHHDTVQLTDAERIYFANISRRTYGPPKPEDCAACLAAPGKGMGKLPCEEHRCAGIKNVNGKRCRMRIAPGHVLFCQHHGCRYELAPGVRCDFPLAESLVQGACPDHADPHGVVAAQRSLWQQQQTDAWIREEQEAGRWPA
jgi:hypothetical protein